MQKDLKSLINVQKSLAPAAVTATATGSAVDTAGYESATVVLDVGTITDGTHTPKLTECATTGGSYTDVAAADLLGSFAALATGVTQKVGYIGSKQFLKVVVTVAGSPATGGVYGGLIVLSHARHNPAGATQVP
jgi:hypothetical protein